MIDGEGDIKRVGIIACSKTKVRGARLKGVPAKELYTGALFKLAARYVQRECDRWAIVSAKYGLVQPNTVIKSYEKTLHGMSAKDHVAWCRMVRRQVFDMYRPDITPTLFVVLAGELYRDALELDIGPRLDVAAPLKGMGIGEQLGWLKRELGDGEHAPIPMIIHCPSCHGQHVDEGEWKTRPHRSHRCSWCDCTFRLANVPTVGVAELPDDEARSPVGG